MAVATLAREKHDFFYLGGTKAHGVLARTPRTHPGHSTKDGVPGGPLLSMG